jgi:phospholipase A1
MIKMSFINRSITILAFLFINTSAYADNTVVDKQMIKEKYAESNPFAITFFKQNYILPIYYTGSPYNSIYLNSTPGNEKLNDKEIKYQLSLKFPAWKNILGSKTSLYFAYTQLSYWQAYNNKAFFRETDYQPELFFTHPLNLALTRYWIFNEIRLGASHQSNGFGNDLERSWNRVYVEAISSTENFMFAVKTWYVIKDSTYQNFNPDLANYLGYGELTFSYKFHDQVISLQTHNLIESGGKHATGNLSYSFPLTKYVNGFVQVFSGYGQSMIEYNHRTNSAGLGISLNDYS